MTKARRTNFALPRSNPEVFYLGTAPLYDANGSLSDGLALVGTQVCAVREKL